ncbi:MAG: hypothetical protein CL846_00145 [Crocinitomicaceae bacterium]|nr:hypothetical protein [Crocinitomicaceae bacterium]
MKKWQLIVISILSLNLNIFSQKMSIYEDSLINLLEKVHFSKNIDSAMKFNNSFKKTLKRCLNDPNAFDFPFDSISNFMSTKAAPDGAFRLFNWNIELKNQTQHYECIILKKDNKGNLQLIELFDKKNTSFDFEFQIINEKNWKGALYFDIIPVKKNNKTIYTLLGWDGNNMFSNIKIIETLSFVKKNNVQFGTPIFNCLDGKVKRRVVFQYNKKSYMSLKHVIIKKEHYLVFDHLIPTSPHLKDFPDWYVTDLSFDAFKWQDDSWNFIQDFDAKSNR